MLSATNSEPNVLVVEDNPLDVRLIKLALEQGGLTKAPTVLDDGGPALALLRREKEYEGHPIPDLIILDLNLKRVDGAEVLAFVRRTEKLCDICVAILSSSPADILSQRVAEANCYFSKPSDIESYTELGKELLNCYQRNLRSLRRSQENA